MMSLNHFIELILIIVIGITITNGLKCQRCGQYNEGAGSITPCFNYSANHSELYLKECNSPSELFCVKYVTELTVVRDCAKKCDEKDIWKTQTYCCTEENCNTGNILNLSKSINILLTSIIFIISKINI